MQLIDLLVPLLTFIAVLAIGGAIVVIVRHAKASQRLSRRVAIETTRSDSAAALSSSTGLSAQTMGGVAEDSQGDSYGFLDTIGRMVAGGGVSSKLRQNLARAGYFGEAAAPIYLGVKMLVLVLSLFLCAILFLVPAGLPGAETIAGLSNTVKFMIVIWGAGLLFFIPNIVVDLARRRRSNEVREHLPDAVDLLEVCVSSGMGLDMAWNAVTEEVRPVSTVLADEMTLANLEMQLGAPRAVAMRRMAERTGAEELSSLVAMFVQTERFGTSVAETLRTFASSMRDNRSQQAEEMAEKMAVKLLFPMVLFIFPVTLLITVGPAAVGIWEVLLGN